MSQIGTTIPPKGIGSIQISDFWKSLFIAALSNVLLALYTIINRGDLPTHADLMVMIKTTAAIILAYLLKNLSTNNVGQMFTRDKPVVQVDAQALDELKQKAEDTAFNDPIENKQNEKDH